MARSAGRRPGRTIAAWRRREQLAGGGRLVSPVGGRRRQPPTVVRREPSGALRERPRGPVRFVPPVGAQGWLDQ
jgi:protein-L-isoaspartate O-methyltransferase